MYSAKIEGEATTFGTSGMLYRNNKLMYDRATNTLWASLLGEPVIGPLADSGIKLDLFPVELTLWVEWVARHPDSTVLSAEPGVYPASRYRSEGDLSSIYFAYRNDPDTMFPAWNRDRRLETKDEVLAISIVDAHKAYPIKVLRQERVVNDDVAGTGVVVIASSLSTGARVYGREGQVFSLPSEGETFGGLPLALVDSDGLVWTVTEDALVNTSDPSETLARLPSHPAFWFGWFAFHPDTLLYEPKGDS